MQRSTPSPRRAFSIMELLFAIAVIFVLMGLLLAGLRLANRSARGAVDTSTANSLKQATDKFIQEFGFVPALVKDADPVVGNPPRPDVYRVSTPADLAFLRNDTPGTGDARFSVYSLAYYVMGGLPLAVDGKDGPGFTTPTRDGGFERKGRLFDPFFDTSKNAKAIFNQDVQNGLIELRDSNNIAFRYYRWVEDDTGPVSGQPINDYLNVPAMVGNAEEREDIRSAKYAIVAAGANGLFGDEMELGPPHYLDPTEMESRLGLRAGTPPADIKKVAMADNIVVIGGGK